MLRVTCSPSALSISVKVDLGGGVFVRFDASTLTYGQLSTTVKKPGVFHYLDEDGDVCIVSDDFTLRGALAYLSGASTNSSTTIRLGFSPTVPKPSASLPKPPSRNIKRLNVDSPNATKALSKHQALIQMRDAGLTDMQANLKTLKATHMNPSKAISILKGSKPTKHEALRILRDAGFDSMERNLIALRQVDNDPWRAMDLLTFPVVQPLAVKTASFVKRQASVNHDIIRRHQNLARLLDLGFSDMARNIQALNAAKDDLNLAVEHLLR